MRIIFENEEIENNLFKSLRAYIRKNITPSELVGSDSHIYKIINSNSNLAQSEIIFDLDDDEKLFELLNLSDDDGWFARWITNSNSNIDIENFDSLWDDFIQGYGSLYNNMNDENLKRLNEIMIKISGQKINFNSDESLAKSNEILNSIFPRECDDMVYEYKEYLNEEIRQSASESIMNELNDFLEKIGFKFYNKFDMLKTTPANLLMWFTLINDTNLNFIELFEQICKKLSKKTLIGGWYDNQYEFRDSNYFDNIGYNNNIERIIDKMEEKIDNDPKYQKYSEELSNISSQFNFNQVYPFKANPDYKFRIGEFDINNGKLSMVIYHNDKRKVTKISIDGFLKLYQQPTLFKLETLFD